MKYTPEQLDEAALQDLRWDAEAARKQADEGPFFAEIHGNPAITRESLLAYAAKCDAAIERYKAGGAHAAVLAGTATPPCAAYFFA